MIDELFDKFNEAIYNRKPSTIIKRFVFNQLNYEIKSNEMEEKKSLICLMEFHGVWLRNESWLVMAAGPLAQEEQLSKVNLFLCFAASFASLFMKEEKTSKRPS